MFYSKMSIKEKFMYKFLKIKKLTSFYTVLNIQNIVQFVIYLYSIGYKMCQVFSRGVYSLGLKHGKNCLSNIFFINKLQRPQLKTLP